MENEEYLTKQADLIAKSILTEFEKKNIEPIAALSALLTIVNGYLSQLPDEDIDATVEKIRETTKRFKKKYIK